jgi:hypothetical protein
MRTDLTAAEQNRSPLPNINGGENYNCWNPPEDFRPVWTETICGLASRCSKSTEKKLDFAVPRGWRRVFLTPSASCLAPFSMKSPGLNRTEGFLPDRKLLASGKGKFLQRFDV